MTRRAAVRASASGLGRVLPTRRVAPRGERSASLSSKGAAPRSHGMEAQKERRDAFSIPNRTTLLDLLAVVNDHTSDDAAAVRLIVALVNSGTVSLTGNFRGARFQIDAAP